MVILITPPNQRLELIKEFSKAGKHILMEKPIERSTKQAEEIVKICENNKVQLGIVLQHRFRESSIKLKNLLDKLIKYLMTNPKSIYHHLQSFYEIINSLQDCLVCYYYQI